MATTITELLPAIREVVRALEPRCTDGARAAELVDEWAEAERLCAAAKALCAQRAATTGTWRRAGYRSAAHWLAFTSGSTLSAAIDALDTADRLDGLPETAEAFRAGELSTAQAQLVTNAAAADPAAERRLLDMAPQVSVKGLRAHARSIEAAARPDEELDRYRAIHDDRSLRHWTDRDGVFRLDARLTPDAGATVLAGLRPFTEHAFRQARAEQQRESHDAYAADGLVALARAASSGADAERRPKALVRVRVDHAAFRRGHTEPGELCEIAGVGPVPVPVAQRLAQDAIVEAVVTRGGDVTAIATVGRTMPAKLRAALEWRDPVCVNRSCDVADGLEVHHLVPIAERNETTLDGVVLICAHDHDLITYEHYRLEGSHQAGWYLTPPTDSVERAPPGEAA